MGEFDDREAVWLLSKRMKRWAVMQGECTDGKAEGL